jgi:hypothetical protein
MYGRNIYAQPHYTGYGYPNYGQGNYMQPQQQMAQPQMQQPVQYETPIHEIRFVNSKEAEGFIVMPNSNVLLIDKNSGMAHFKTADNMGQSATKYFKFVQVNEDGTPLKTQEPTPQVDYSQFLTQKDLDGLPTAEQYKKLAEQYNTLLAKIETMQKIIAGGKPNVNGTNTAKGN